MQMNARRGFGVRVGMQGGFQNKESKLPEKTGVGTLIYKLLQKLYELYKLFIMGMTQRTAEDSSANPQKSGGADTELCSDSSRNAESKGFSDGRGAARPEAGMPGVRGNASFGWNAAFSADTGSSAQQGTAQRLQEAVLWAEVLGDPVSVKRRRQRENQFRQKENR